MDDIINNNPMVCIQKSSYSNLEIKSLLEPFGGMKHFIKKGERVLLKVNLLNASTPEKPVLTHPAVVSAVAQLVLDVGGVPFIGDSPGGPFTKRRLDKVYERSGMKKAASDLGIELNYDTTSKKIDIPNGKRLKKTPICNFYLNSDKIISIPKLKTHSLMIMTLASKIMYGVVPGLSKAKYHSTNIKKNYFAEMLVDLLSITKTDLIIMDGIVGMQGNGPGNGIPVDLGVLFASTYPIAMDVSICKMLGIEPVGVPLLRIAKVRGMIPSKINYPLLSVEDVEYKGFELPSTAGYALTGKKKPKRSPIPDENCNGCRRCKEICPKDAIEIVDGKATIDYSNCIRCFCCHEICPEDAIQLEVLR
jgi:uncharacterized protein (DUF362 family)